MLYQVFILGGLLMASYLIDPRLVTIVLVGGSVLTFLRPIPEEYFYLNRVRRYQVPIIRLKRALSWVFSALIAFVIVFFVFALFDLV